MKPEYPSFQALHFTQSIAKMIEFDVPEQDRKINIKNEPERLFPLTIGLLGDYCYELLSENPNETILLEIGENLRFCATFFDSYKNSNRIKEAEAYLLLIGAITFFLADLPGSCNVLINKLNNDFLDLDASGLEILLLHILKEKNSFENIQKDSIYYSKIKEIICLYFNYRAEGINESTLLQCIKELVRDSKENGNDRELLFASLIYAICKKKIEYSCWKNLPLFTNIKINKWKNIIQKKSFIKELWPSQLLLGQNEVFNGSSAVIQMPTSAGKTKSTEIIIRSAFMQGRTNIAVIVAPFRALCNEIKLDYLRAFYGEDDIEINSINDAFDEEDIDSFQDTKIKHIIILTPEKLYYLFAHNKEISEQVKLIIYDEGHQFDTGTRGVTYELLLTELNNFLPPDCQKVLISAVIHNAIDISNWLLSENKVVSGMNMSPTLRNIGFVTDSYKIDFVNNINPENIEFFVPRTIIPIRNQDGSVFPLINKPNEVASYYALKLCHKNMVAIYIHRKDWITNLLKTIIQHIDAISTFSKPAINCNQEELSKILMLVEKNEGNTSILYKAVSYGLFPHHTNIPEGIRNSIEYAAHESLINFLICTSTLAQGVNLPIRYLFITTSKQGESYFKIRDFQNFIGRVGRAGILTEGSIVFTDTKLRKDDNVWYHIKRLLNSDNSENCQSSLAEIFEPFKNENNKFSKWNFKDIKILVDFYYDEKYTARDFAHYFVQKNEGFDEELLTAQIEKKFRYIEQVENFLMILNEELSQDLITKLAESTFAYYLANDNEQKEQIKQLFIHIGNKFLEREIETSKLNKYSKTMHGLDYSIELESRINEKTNEIKKCETTDELFNVFWNIFDKNIDNKYYLFISNREKIRNAVYKWISGKSYIEILDELKNEKVSSNRKINMEYCVDIFENGLSYSGSILISAIKELLPDEILTIDLDSLLLLFQKQIKYGLPNITSINLYEMGFCDRFLSQEIAKFCNNEKEKLLIEQQLCLHEIEISNLLKNYPSYFTNVFQRLVNKHK